MITGSRSALALDDRGQSLVHGVEHGVLAEQVVDGVAGEGQFREHGDRDAGLGQPPTDVDDALPRCGAGSAM